MIEDHLHSCPPDVGVGDVSVFDDVVEYLVEGEEFAVVAFVAYFACYFLLPDGLIAEVLLLNELHLLEGVHLDQFEECLRSELTLLPQQLMDYVDGQHSQQHRRYSKLKVVGVS